MPTRASRRRTRWPALRRAKYWSPVGRVDNVYGDRNLFCTCLPMSDLRNLNRMAVSVFDLFKIGIGPSQLAHRRADARGAPVRARACSTTAC